MNAVRMASELTLYTIVIMAVVQDLQSMKISNRLILAGLVLSLVFGIILGRAPQILYILGVWNYSWAGTTDLIYSWEYILSGYRVISFVSSRRAGSRRYQAFFRNRWIYKFEYVNQLYVGGFWCWRCVFADQIIVSTQPGYKSAEGGIVYTGTASGKYTRIP